MTGPAGKSRASRLSRREVLGLGGAALALPMLPGPAFAEMATETPLHGLSAFGSLKYGADFTRFDYANPDAPKGGTFNFSPPNWAFNQNTQTFNTLNTFVAKGDAPPRMELCFDSLMTRAIDEPDAIYGLLARSVTVSADRNTFTFKLRPQARFHDGSPVTAEDVAFSYRTFREQGHPSLLLPLREMVAAEAADGETFRLVFSGRQSGLAILTLAVYPILSKAYFSQNPFDASTLDPPLGSGPYRVERTVPGQTVIYQRDPGYWARDLPVRRGLFHFDRIRIDFFRERQAGFEAFKKGDVTYRQEFTSKTWATEYGFPAVLDGRVVKRTFPRELQPTLQGWAINQRRKRFSDWRIREAVGLCFDFEWTRKTMFYGSYVRSQSLFANSEFEAAGTPDSDELELLERFRGRVPDGAFDTPFTQPVSDGSGRDRKLLRRAVKLIRDAGWKRDNGIFVNGDGEKLSLEILVRSPVFVRVDTPFVENMRAIGIDASIRQVDPTQYQARLIDFDFDMVGMALGLGATPTQEGLENLLHSRAATTPGSRNLAGIADPAIDALVEQVGRATSRRQLVVAMRVLDRVLRSRQDWIPNWHAANHRAAFWDMFGFTEPKPDYGFPVEALWWFDSKKAEAIGKA
jgi:microcin C transport system substrate-binding protein